MFAMYNVFGIGYWISSATNYILVSIISFFLNKYWTFKVQKWSLFMVPAFVLNIAISYFVAYKLARVVIHLILADYSEILRDNTAMLAGICLFAVLNYFGQRFIVFRK
jgi:putative flippase GtrA